MPAMQAPTTLAQWEARALWHVGQADALLTDPPADAVALGSRASAHARTAQAICELIQLKVIK